MIDQRFDPKDHEQRIFKRWEEAGCFKPSGVGEPYAIMIPPPNVTGSLHMGHALNNTIQDILCRFERMRGKNVRWQPGMDHAGIATQMVVERKLAASGANISRRDMGREAFVEKVWEWKEESGGTILNQLRRLGASCDWDNTKFTLDDDLNKAVNKVFVDLYNEGLIYRAKRLVNWDPHFQTAISNLEVENKEVDGHMWHFKYPLAGGETYTYVEKDEDGNITLEEERDYISIATTRPETMLGDGAVAVHPSDERYAPIVGKLCEIPVGPKEQRRLIPIITDEYPDPDFGSGAVKITGAHDFNDYQVAKRGKIPMYALMDEKGYMRADGRPYAEEAAEAQQIAEGQLDWDEAKISAMNLVPEAYRGLERFEARKAVIADITAEGNAVMIADPKWKPEEGETGDAPLIPLVENKKIMQPFGDRSGVVIEPMLTDQWFVDAETLAKPAIEAVRSGETTFVPENWDRTYYNWMENIEPWCISRQLWWGHQVPVWYGPELGESGEILDPTGKAFCAQSWKQAQALAEEYYKDRTGRMVEVQEIPFVDDGIGGRAEPLGIGIGALNSGEEQGTSGGVHAVRLGRDPDVLDTWFSSALWPFSTQGWPEETDALKTFYPGAVLVTAFDIIFFWVARMMMMGMKFMDGEVPFKDVYIHAIVRDENGKKMSKSEGNVIDPVDLIDGIEIEPLVAKRTTGLRQPEKAPKVEKETRKKYPKGFDAYGADALRFTLAAMATKGRDINLAVDRVAGYRNFGTKLWNATRFAQMSDATFGGELDPATLKSPINRWIVSELYTCANAVTEAIEDYRFNDAASAVYHYIWDIFCDWFIELSKPVLQGEDGAAKTETQATLGWTLERIYTLLHPFCPFITEVLWEQTGQRDNFVMQQDWVGLKGSFEDAEASRELQWVLQIVSTIRSVRSDVNVPAGAKVPASLVGANEETARRIEAHSDVICRLARLEKLTLVEQAATGAVRSVVDEATIALEVADFVDPSAEVERLTKQLDKLKKEIGGLNGRLSNEAFVAKAPPEVVAEQRERLLDLQRTEAKLLAAKEQLSELLGG
ncbi:valine--tRNA ligase [Hyphomonas sp. FCG-A18]|uniref:valine--tRNA ligase n=1 Tax=Hyphomonas sp. FCG-A18 TaxID=3080019 RepID=UPI0038730E7C